MLRVIFFSSLMSACSVSQSQDLPAKKISDPSTDCGIYLKYFFREDSMTWTGACTDGLAEGHGVMTGFVDGVEISRYINRYAIPRDQIYMGGFSMGGLFSLRYTQLSRQDKSKTVIAPKAVFSCDGPVDLLNLHADFSKKAASGHRGESQYALREFDQYLGGSPQTHRTEYIRHSAHSVEDVPLSNAKYLVEVPVRIYGDVDPVWWIDNRGVDMYDLNALDQTAMIVYLNQLGNDNATFINAYGKGYRIEGWRHPHSWSIIDGKEIVNWLLQLQ